VRADATILDHSSNSSLYDVLLPAGSKDDLYKLCVTVEGVDAFQAKAAVTITVRVSRLFFLPHSVHDVSKNSHNFILTYISVRN